MVSLLKFAHVCWTNAVVTLLFSSRRTRLAVCRDGIEYSGMVHMDTRERLQLHTVLVLCDRFTNAM